MQLSSRLRQILLQLCHQGPKLFSRVDKVHVSGISHLLCPGCKAQRTNGLVQVLGTGRCRDQQRGAGISAQRLFEDAREGGISVRNMCAPFDQGINHLSQGRQGGVDLLRLFQGFSDAMAATHPFAARQIHQIQLSEALLPRIHAVRDRHNEHRMASGGMPIHLGFGLMTVAIANAHHLHCLVHGSHGRFGHGGQIEHLALLTHGCGLQALLSNHCTTAQG
mmetsp:Transcript_65560/g.143773  ORF Transcript_65560/g.143773 Transcript_65560/m.143773 type:complete len:221 (+) Transcript_65560:1412-2074(+)